MHNDPTDIGHERFADQITGHTIRSIEFGDSAPTEIAIHLSNGETFFVGAEVSIPGMGEVEPRLYFQQYQPYIDGTVA